MKYLNLKNNNRSHSYTLVELLVAVTIIIILSGILLLSIKSAKAKSRDNQRLSDMKQIQLALELYYNNNGHYPYNTDPDAGSWDYGYFVAGDVFIQPLEGATGLLMKTPGDPSFVGSSGYAYYRYGAGGGGCDVSRGAFYVLGVYDMETSGRPYGASPGFSCLPTRNWQGEFDWVTGGYEN